MAEVYPRPTTTRPKPGGPGLPAPAVGQVWESRNPRRRYQVTIDSVNGQRAICRVTAGTLSPTTNYKLTGATKTNRTTLTIAVVQDMRGLPTLGNYRLIADADGRPVVYQPGGARVQEVGCG